MRIEEVFQNNQKLNTGAILNSEAGRQKAIISVLTDISETLAILVDLYGIVHGRTVSTREEQKNAPEA